MRKGTVRVPFRVQSPAAAHSETDIYFSLCSIRHRVERLTLPRAATGRRGFPPKAMVCAFIVMKCEGFAQITNLMDSLQPAHTSAPCVHL